MRDVLRLYVQKAGLAVLTALHADQLFDQEKLWSGGVLMLHRVRPRPEHAFQPNAGLEITPDFLDRALDLLKRRGIAVVSLEEAADRIRCGRQTDRYLAITLDDGYRDNHDHAWPVFRAHGAPFTVFVATGMVDGTANAWWMTLEEVVRDNETVAADIGGTRRIFDTRSVGAKRKVCRRLAGHVCSLGETGRDAFVRRLAIDHGFDVPAMLRREMMNWDEVRALSTGPLSAIGGHTVSHPALTLLSDHDARREILGGLDRLEAMTGRRPTTFAYPYGDSRSVSERDIQLASELGFSVAVTTRRGMLKSEQNRRMTDWPRLSVNGHFQSIREFEMLLSGVPFHLEQLGWRSVPFLRPTRRASVPVRST